MFRGVQMRLAGTQVLRRLQPGRYQYTYWLFGNVLNQAVWSKEKSALVQRLSTAWEREIRVRGRDPFILPDLPEDGTKAGGCVQRVALEHIPITWSTLFNDTVLQEPQFQEILVAYRLQDRVEIPGQLPWSPPVDLPPQRAIHLRRFWEVPMKDIKLVLPQETWHLRGRPLDTIKFDLITLFGILGALSHLNGGKLILTLAPLFVLLVRTFLGYRRVKEQAKSVTNLMLFQRCLDKDAALMRLLPDAAESQVFAECLLVLYALTSAGAIVGQSEEQVEESVMMQSATAAVAQILEQADLPSAGVRPNLAAAVDRLCDLGVVHILRKERGPGAEAPPSYPESSACRHLQAQRLDEMLKILQTPSKQEP